jgi:hypothetical protein
MNVPPAFERMSHGFYYLRILALAVLSIAAARGVADDPAGHWAWKPPVRPAVPPGAANPVDAFVRAKQAAAGVKPAAPATREQLIRRVTFDLTGLPPTPAEVDAFVKDPSADAWEKVVDRLLASPRYGERWARQWLDLARYADSNGYEHDEPRPDAWRYRDYVVRSFNEDKRYDRFVIEQLAGDEAYPGNPVALVATGFNLLGPDMTDAADAAQRRLNTLTDMTDTAGLAFLGLTLTCARCHDHKFEPLSQKDYFRFQAFFTPAGFRRDLPVATRAEQEKHAAAAKAYQDQTRPMRDEIAAIEGPHRTRLYEAKLKKLSTEAQAAFHTPPDKRDGGQLELVAQLERLTIVSDAEVVKALSAEDRTKVEELKKTLKTFDHLKPSPAPVAMGLTDRPGPPEKTYLLERGELSNRGGEVEAGFPAVLLPNLQPTPASLEASATGTGRRLALARWVVDPKNPLAARVIVNRLWQHHFGRGIVATPSDFGLRGERPTHPELLDWLATELVARDWSLKQMHRIILTSETYRQSTQADAATFEKDPDNKLLTRMARHRLDGEAVRDSLLSISGRLNPAMFGPPVVPPELTAGQGGGKPAAATKDATEYDRRSIYLFARRNARHPFLGAFDLPDSNLSCPKRERSTTAPQALALLNAELVTTAATALSDRLSKEATTDAERIELAYRLCLGRVPTEKEQDRAVVFLKESPLSELCRALFNMNEFMYLD